MKKLSHQNPSKPGFGCCSDSHLTHVDYFERFAQGTDRLLCDDRREERASLAGHRSLAPACRSDSRTCWLQNRIEAFEFDARILGGQAPIDLNLLRVAFRLPGSYLEPEQRLLTNPPRPAIARSRPLVQSRRRVASQRR